MNDSEKPVYRITDLATEERPRERLVHLGPQALAAAELLAILLRVGVPGENAIQVGQRLLKDFGGISGLQRAPWKSYVINAGLERPKLLRSRPPSN
jgi:DNA repair protein RadC